MTASTSSPARAKTTHAPPAQAARKSARRAPSPEQRSARKPAAAESFVAASAVAPAAKEAATASTRSREKLVRDSYTMPRSDVQLIETLKARAIAFHRPAKKSELLRAGLHALAVLSDERLRISLDALTPLKPGRPKKAA